MGHIVCEALQECAKHSKSVRSTPRVCKALQDVHQTIANQDISVKFGWIKFKMNWHCSGFGWYAGIDITKNGK